MEFIQQDQNLVNQAIELKNNGKYDEALKILKEIEQKHINNTTLIGLIASVCFLAKDYSRSLLYFQKITTLKPKSEIASIGLFHSFWNLSSFNKALQEAFRYLLQDDVSVYDYKILLQDLFQGIEEDGWEKEEADMITILWKEVNQLTSFKN